MKIEITNNFDYASDETNTDIEDFNESKCAIIVYDEDGCLCDDDEAVDFDINGELSKDIYNITEGVYSYEGNLSTKEVESKLISMGYNLY